MRRLILAALLAASAPAAIAAPTPKEQLLVPPARRGALRRRLDRREAWRHVALDAARRHALPTAFAVAARLDHRDRPDGHARPRRIPTEIAIRGMTPNGDAAETLRSANGKAHWVSPVDEGSAVRQRADIIWRMAAVRLPTRSSSTALVAAGAKGIDLLPSGHATLKESADS